MLVWCGTHASPSKPAFFDAGPCRQLHISVVMLIFMLHTKAQQHFLFLQLDLRICIAGAAQIAEAGVVQAYPALIKA